MCAFISFAYKQIFVYDFFCDLWDTETPESQVHSRLLSSHCHGLVIETNPHSEITRKNYFIMVF